MLNQLKYLILTMRPKQWFKNLLVFVALIFSVNQHWDFNDLNQVGHLLAISFLAYIIFCLLSGIEYLINDLIDVNADRQHPKKKERPIASGKLNLTFARIVAYVSPLVILPLSYWLSESTDSGIGFGVIATLYFLVALIYSLKLKRIVILDILAIAGGFVLRTIAGAIILSFPISPWLYICTLLLALFLALGKRRQELMLLGDNSGDHRRTLTEYTPKLIDQMITLVTTAVIISYCLYTFTAENLPDNNSMMLTIPFVLYGIFRYLYMVHIKGKGGNPLELLTQDKPLMATVFLWVVAVILILLFS